MDPAPRPSRTGWRAAAGVAALLALFCALALATWRRNGAWETELALWSDAAAKAPGKARVHLSLGYALRRQGRYDEAIAEYRRGLAVVGGDADLRLQLERNLGAALIWAGRGAEAVAVLEGALRLEPLDSELLGNLGSAAVAARDWRRAEGAARRAVALDPRNGSAWNVLGVALQEQGGLDGARAAFAQAAALDPDDGLPARNLAKVLERLGDRPGACAAWARARGGRLAADGAREVEQALAACR